MSVVNGFSVPVFLNHGDNLALLEMIVIVKS